MQGRILVRPTSGLCNRLNVVSSFAALAKRSDRTLELCWSASPGWSDEDLGELFENGFSRVSQETFDAANVEALRLDGEVTVSGTGGLNEDLRYGDGPGFAAVFDSVAYPVVTYSGHRPCQDLLPPKERRRLLPGFSRDVRDELQSWRPVAPIRERVAEIAHEFDGGTVGVHVRRGDAIRHRVMPRSSSAPLTLPSWRGWIGSCGQDPGRHSFSRLTQRKRSNAFRSVTGELSWSTRPSSSFRASPARRRATSTTQSSISWPSPKHAESSGATTARSPRRRLCSAEAG